MAGTQSTGAHDRTPRDFLSTQRQNHGILHLHTEAGMVNLNTGMLKSVIFIVGCNHRLVLNQS
ncbi:hypothetical protein BJP44_06890 [Candidatus Williamhamiltonella defendens]|nr:hypothetical protein BJP44_06890 [Candidatus Hamiltonella defensa]